MPGVLYPVVVAPKSVWNSAKVLPRYSSPNVNVVACAEEQQTANVAAKARATPNFAHLSLGSDRDIRFCSRRSCCLYDQAPHRRPEAKTSFRRDRPDLVALCLIRLRSRQST